MYYSHCNCSLILRLRLYWHIRVSSSTSVAVLNFEQFVWDNRKKILEILEKYHYIPIFLLCELSILLKASPDKIVDTSTYFETYFQYITIFIATTHLSL